MGSISTVPISQYNPIFNQSKAHMDATTYKENLTREKIRIMIELQVSDPPTEPIKEYVKVMKSVQPPTYSGKDNNQKFTAWLNGFLTYCRRLNITGPRNEEGHTDLLTQVLKDDAALWLYNNIQLPTHQCDEWTFEETILALYQRFIMTDAYQEAEVNFNNVRWDGKRGAIGLSKDFNQWATRMLEHPSEKVLCDKFIGCLPEKVEHQLIVHDQLDPHFTPYKIWCSEAIRLQQAEESIHTQCKISS